MVILEDLSRDELKKICLERGVKNYHNLSKPKLIKLLNSLGESESEQQIEEKIKALESEEENIIQEKDLAKEEGVVKEEDIIKEEKKKKKHIQLSIQAQNWRDYLAKINVKPSMFLHRYPNHRYRVFIEELIEYEKSQNSLD
jgi:hypothetical protein